MSFYSNFQSDKCPGAITGNPVNGLTEKVCIQAEKIFDACIKQTQLENYALTLTDLSPENPTYPLTFVSARSVSAEATVTNLNVERQADKACARVQATVSIPVEVLYTDAAGVEGSATAIVSINQDVLLYVPCPSIMPFTVKAVASAVAPEGVFNAETLIVGFAAGVIGILVSLFFIAIINVILLSLTGLETLQAVLPVGAAVILVLISMGLTLVAGLFPAKVAAKKDPVIALRSE